MAGQQIWEYFHIPMYGPDKKKTKFNLENS